MTLDERERLISKHLSRARALASRFRGRGVELEDLHQEAALGLCVAADRFDPEANPGVPFWAYVRFEVLDRVTAAVSAVPPANQLGYDPEAPAPDAHLERAAGDLWYALDSLSDRDRAIVIRRWGLDGGPLAGPLELASEFGLGYRRVHQILQQALQAIGRELVLAGWTNRARRPSSGARSA
jgi:RNA polymerase sigma factor (sigma-70 family)